MTTTPDRLREVALNLRLELDELPDHYRKGADGGLYHAINPEADEIIIRQLAAEGERGEIEGNRLAIERVRASLKEYPKNGGDLEILSEVDRLVKAEGERARRAGDALTTISKMPCLTNLLGESAEDNGGCSCAACIANDAIRREGGGGWMR